MNKSIAEIRQIFLDFFSSKGHKILASSSLIPKNDSTLLFTNAGMNQFKDIFLGLAKPSYCRIATSQRCVRAGGKHNDLENVGYTTRHHTFFEMLGNFSFGDYFKYDAIKLAWELLTGAKWFNIPKEKLWITVYSTDDESYNIWAHKIGVPLEHIVRIGDNKGHAYASDNFWQMGETGPCGPCSEIFYDYGDHINGSLSGSLEKKGDRYIEIWNLVFIQFNRQLDGTLLPLPKLSIDTGMGLERISAVLQYVNSNYDIDLFKKLISAVIRVTGYNSNPDNNSLRVIADHIRSSSFIISDGVVPSNDGRGYVLRRIIRRAIYHGKMLGVNKIFFYKLVAPLINIMDSAASHLLPQKKLIEQVLRAEEEQFDCTLKRGLNLLNKILSKKLSGNTLDGETAFRLYDTYGFPLDITIEICRKHNLFVDKAGFKQAMEAQRNRSRQLSNFNVNSNIFLYSNKTTHFLGYEYLRHYGQIVALSHNGQLVDSVHPEDGLVIMILNETPFYGESGGQVGDCGILKSLSGIFKVLDTKNYGKIIGHHGIVKHGSFKISTQVTAQVNKTRRKRVCLNHSAAHLLYAALRQTLGIQVNQKGFFVNEYYLRFDFFHNKAMKKEQIYELEKIVNKYIRYNIPIQTHIMSLEDARNKGAIMLCGKKYDSQVRVLSIGNFSIELCKGTHANRTGDIGLFHIIAEVSIASGIRRIEAITGDAALASLQQENKLVDRIAQLVKGDRQTLINKIGALQKYTYRLETNIQQLKNQWITLQNITLCNNIRNINGVKVLVNQFDNIEPKILLNMIDNLKNKLKSAVIVFATVRDDKIRLIVGVTKDLLYKIKADDIINYLAKQINGKGGGRPDLAQAGGDNFSALPAALASIDSILSIKLQT